MEKELREMDEAIEKQWPEMKDLTELAEMWKKGAQGASK